MIKKINLLWSMIVYALMLQAQAPENYYDAASGRNGASLKTALFNIITSHTQRSYSDLWEDFKKTDARSDGKVWDMYSNITNYTFGVEQGKNYKQEGDSYNREHSFPKSWFNDAYPMYTDLFHLYPTDGYTNGRRSNLPFGEVKNATWSSNGGFSKVGSCSVSGYSGTVFEPNDEYKGDFARTYFYMATCYEDRISSWDSPMLAGNKYPAYASWAVSMLLRWAAEDPVSQKEIDRNNAVYEIQKNRNPYIDFPGLEQFVWGSRQNEAFNPNDYEQGGGTDKPDIEVAAPTFSHPSGQVERGTEVIIDCDTQGAYIYYTVNGDEEEVTYPPVRLTINKSTSIKAYAMLGTAKSEEVSANYTIPGSALTGENIFVRIEDASDLKTGMHCLIVCESKNVALAEQAADIRAYAEVTPSAGEVTTNVNSEGYPYSLVLGGTEGAWTFYDATDATFLALTSSANKLHSSTSATEKTAQWTISIAADGSANIYNAEYDNRSIRYNSGAPRFACYKSGQQAVAIYAIHPDALGIDRNAQLNERVTVYDLSGRIIRHQVARDEAFRTLPSGIYVINGRKVLIR